MSGFMEVKPKVGCWDTYKGAGAATCLSLLTASLFVLRSKEPSSSCNEVVLWWSEIIKFVVALGMVAKAGDMRRICYKAYHSGVPTVTYAIISLLTYWALKHTDASAAAFISQLKLPATALFSFLLLGRMLSTTKLMALITIMLASLGIAAYTNEKKGQDESTSSASDQLYFLATLAIVTESCLSAFTGVYTQWLFEGSFDTLWIRNLQLGLFSTVVYYLKAMKEESCLDESGMVDLAIDTRGTIIMIMQAAMGLSVALTLLWLGAIEKTLASISSIVLTSVWEHVGYIHAWPPLIEVILDLTVIQGILMYSTLK